MPDTNLILHVKGTEAETAVLPKDVVRAGISEGKISHSQLIWIPTENTWKQVKELPELLPVVERLILHVKGTEAETQELPKQEVRAAISQGKMTHSQLIWIPSENTWKPVRELPDLMPGETLILHVKGTESETKELPKQEVQAAVSKGQITHSQLIWIPKENTWKPVRELPDLLPGERLILHVKGTEAETKELPRKAIRAALTKGEITHSQLIWSPNEHAWKQVREIPELLPSQKLAPAPTREALQAVPRIVDGIIPESPTNPVSRAIASSAQIPQVRVAAAAGSTPKVRVATAAGSPPKVHVAMAAAAATPQVKVAEAAPTDAVKVPVVTAANVPQVRVAAATPAEAAPVPVAAAASVPQVRVVPATAEAPQVRVATATDGVPKVLKAVAVNEAPKVLKAASPKIQPVVPVQPRNTAHLKVENEDGFHPVKWLCIGLGIVVFLVVGINYSLVDQPLTANLGQTKFANVTVYGHLGAYMQPNVLVIHIPPSEAVTPETLTKFLVALAASTPEPPFSHDSFGRVALTSGWTAQYSFSGYAWKQLGEMTRDTEADRKEFLMAQMGDAAGQSLLPESTLNEEAQQARRDVVWGTFVAQFTARH